MNEITRIHLAKTPYDVEVAAKKELEKYIKNVEKYANDADVVQDVEIRMTELLAERGVRANGIIASADVASIREQLGEPQAFADVDEEGDMAIGPEDDDDSRREPRKLYRNMDDALLGGVLSGIASYFQVNPIWTRLVFVILLFMSFGFVCVVYFLFWIVAPPARTAAEKLQMSGRPVTLNSIRKLSAEDAGDAPRTPILQSILRIGAGVASLFAAFGIFIGTIIAAISSMTVRITDTEFAEFIGAVDGRTAWLIGGLVCVGLLLLAAMFAVAAYALLFKRFTKRIGISLIVIVLAGLTTFVTVLGVGAVQSINAKNEVQRNVREVSDRLPAGFDQVQKVVVDQYDSTKQSDEEGGYVAVNPPAVIRYVVDDGKPRYEFRGLPGTKPVISVDGDTATLKVRANTSKRSSMVQPVLTIYGPALNTISNNQSQFSYTTESQDSIVISALTSGSLTTINGRYRAVTVSGERSNIALGGAAIESLDVKTEGHLQVEAGTVRTLTIQQPDVCQVGASEYESKIRIDGVTSGVMTYNGTERKAETFNGPCAVVVIGPDVML